MIFKLWFTVAVRYQALPASLSRLVGWLERRLPVRGGEHG